MAEMVFALFVGVLSYWVGYTKGYEAGWMDNGKRLGKRIREFR